MTFPFLARRAREDLRAANHRINTMLADYSDVVPRREFEMLETSYKVSEQREEGAHLMCVAVAVAGHGG